MAEKLGTTPEVLINNALLLILKRLEEKVGRKNEKTRHRSSLRNHQKA
jgi:hypothetical protein